MSQILLISVRPRFAAKILSGEKTVELRRVRPRIGAGDCVLIYVSSPVKALAARFVVAEVIQASPSRLWRETQSEAAVTSREFKAYFAGVSTAYAISLKQGQLLRSPVSLDAIRHAWPEFRPPQSYRYLTNQDASRLSPSLFAKTSRPGLFQAA